METLRNNLGRSRLKLTRHSTLALPIANKLTDEIMHILNSANARMKFSDAGLADHRLYVGRLVGDLRKQQMLVYELGIGHR